MRKINHLTPRYIKDRLAVMAFEKSYPDAPWLTVDMIKLLDSWLQPNDLGLEWGSGRSTVWFANRCKNLFSIEQNPEWSVKVEKMLVDRGLLD